MYLPSYIFQLACVGARLVEAGGVLRQSREAVPSAHRRTDRHTAWLMDRHTHELWYEKNKEKLDQQRKKGCVLAVV